VTAADSAEWQCGTYNWQAYVTYGTDRRTIDTGTLVVKPNFAQETSHDGRSKIKVALDAIDAVLESRASKDQEEYSIRGRSLKRTPIPELIKLRDYYAKMYEQEQRTDRLNKGLGLKNRLLTRL
jgi:hypothetical protein